MRRVLTYEMQVFLGNGMYGFRFWYGVATGNGQSGRLSYVPSKYLPADLSRKYLSHEGRYCVADLSLNLSSRRIN